MLWALAEPWLQGCDYLLVTGGVCTLSPHSWQGSGEQERQRLALRWQGNCGTLIHLLLSFQVCVCSVFLAAFCTPPAAEAIPALGTPQLPFLSTGSLRGAAGAPHCHPRVLERPPQQISSWPAVFEPTFLSLHLKSNQPLLFSLTPTFSWRQANS